MEVHLHDKCFSQQSKTNDREFQTIKQWQKTSIHGYMEYLESMSTPILEFTEYDTITQPDLGQSMILSLSDLKPDGHCRTGGWGVT